MRPQIDMGKCINIYNVGEYINYASYSGQDII